MRRVKAFGRMLKENAGNYEENIGCGGR